MRCSAASGKVVLHGHLVQALRGCADVLARLDAQHINEPLDFVPRFLGRLLLGPQLHKDSIL